MNMNDIDSDIRDYNKFLKLLTATKRQMESMGLNTASTEAEEFYREVQTSIDDVETEIIRLKEFKTWGKERGNSPNEEFGF